VQLLRHLAHHLQQPRFDVHVDIFEAVVENELAPVHLPLDGAQPLHQLAGLLFGDDAGLGQHAAVGDTALDIIRVELIGP
jgi:hypothetical protein